MALQEVEAAVETNSILNEANTTIKQADGRQMETRTEKCTKHSDTQKAGCIVPRLASTLPMHVFTALTPSIHGRITVNVDGSLYSQVSAPSPSPPPAPALAPSPASAPAPASFPAPAPSSVPVLASAPAHRPLPNPSFSVSA